MFVKITNEKSTPSYARENNVSGNGEDIRKISLRYNERGVASQTKRTEGGSAEIAKQIEVSKHL